MTAARGGLVHNTSTTLCLPIATPRDRESVPRTDRSALRLCVCVRVRGRGRVRVRVRVQGNDRVQVRPIIVTSLPTAICQIQVS